MKYMYKGEMITEEELDNAIQMAVAFSNGEMERIED